MPSLFTVLASIPWDQVVEQHSDRVFRLAYRLTGNRPDAEDLPGGEARKERVDRAFGQFETRNLAKLLDDWVESSACFTFKIKELNQGYGPLSGVIEDVSVWSNHRGVRRAISNFSRFRRCWLWC